jgi:hypothetical protein
MKQSRSRRTIRDADGAASDHAVYFAPAWSFSPIFADRETNWENSMNRPHRPASFRIVSALSLALFVLPILGTVATERHRAPVAARPFVTIQYPNDTIHWLSAAPFSVQVVAGPPGATIEAAGDTRLEWVDRKHNLLRAMIDNPQPGETHLLIKAVYKRQVALDEKIVIVELPKLRNE